MKKLLSIDGWLELVGIKDFRKKNKIRNAFAEAFINLALTVIMLVIMFIPTYLALGVWFFVSPTSEISKVLLAIGEITIFGSVQLVFIVLGLIGFYGAFFDNKRHYI
jgi:hypothetical protein